MERGSPDVVCGQRALQLVRAVQRHVRIVRGRRDGRRRTGNRTRGRDDIVAGGQRARGAFDGRLLHRVVVRQRFARLKNKEKIKLPN